MRRAHYYHVLLTHLTREDSGGKKYLRGEVGEEKEREERERREEREGKGGRKEVESISFSLLSCPLSSLSLLSFLFLVFRYCLYLFSSFSSSIFFLSLPSPSLLFSTISHVPSSFSLFKSPLPLIQTLVPTLPYVSNPYFLCSLEPFLHNIALQLSSSLLFSLNCYDITK